MKFDLIDLSEEQVEDIEARLEKHDDEHIGYRLPGHICIGIVENGSLIAGADARMTAFKIMYVSTVYVDKQCRGKGIGRLLMESLEKRAALLGANMIRLDTFDWQGAGFYRKLGYEQIGSYSSDADGFAEYFFLKRL